MIIVARIPQLLGIRNIRPMRCSPNMRLRIGMRRLLRRLGMEDMAGSTEDMEDMVMRKLEPVNTEVMLRIPTFTCPASAETSCF